MHSDMCICTVHSKGFWNLDTIHLYIYFRNVRSPCLDPSLGPLQIELPDLAHGRVIPRWNRLGKRN